MDAETTELLNAPLDAANVRPAKKYGPKGDYIEGWHALAEANRIFGFAGWEHVVTELECVNAAPRTMGSAGNQYEGFVATYRARVKISIHDPGRVVEREDVGFGHGHDRDLGLAHESAGKEAVTDAMKRALRTFGNQFGLALYDKERSNVADTSADKAAAERKADAQEVKRIIGQLESATGCEEVERIYAQEKDFLTRIYRAEQFDEFNRVKASKADAIARLTGVGNGAAPF